ncbi:fAD-dependent pyridine nucleotide-disulphide oxidoreductase [Brachyspira sp. CAG:484]|nr:fAD-dependent pyridine nucleotide-disulphide oxidoreductase [Brachyspira sp. CAG:484]
MKVLIIGGGACGASAAARLRRLDDTAEILILEQTEEISIANCGLPYYCSNVINSEEKMHVSSVGKFKNLLNVDIRLGARVTSIDRLKKTVTVNDNEILSYDKLVLAPGANPFKPDIKGIDNPKIFTVRTLNDANMIKAHLKMSNAKEAVVIGGGFIGVEMAENFAELSGVNTTLVEAASHILPPVDKETAAFAHNEMRKHGINLILSDAVTEFGSNEIRLSSGRRIPYDIAVLAIGVKPETSLALACGIQTGKSGGIKVNKFMQTSDENIYAGGDSVEVEGFVTGEEILVPLAGPANRQGRIIADNIAGYKSTYKKSLGSAVVKVFDLTIASAGCSEETLLKRNIPYLKTFTFGFSHASYYPGATRTMYKLLFNKEGDILGIQAAGYEGVEKRVDVMAASMRNGLKVWELIDLELCYAPPYSSAKDPVNILGMHADNILKGFVKPAFIEDIDNAMLIDIRSKAEFERETINGAVNIFTPELRERYKELPRDKKIILFCNTGFQSYVASRILIQRGFDNVYSLAAGITLYKELVKDKLFNAEKVLIQPM